jgi:hypothetical protein
MTKFEQLIEYVINDEQVKARDLFHDIVVEKSRQIYEEMMQEEEELEEADSDEQEDTVSEGDGLGGDQADDLIDDVEAEETGISMETKDDMNGDIAGDMDDAELEDRVVDLEDKLDELMAEFESLMGSEGGDMGGEEEMDIEVDADGGDLDMDMDSQEVVDDELETEGMMEAVSLKAAPAPVKSEEAGINKKSTVAANAGAKGPVGNTVKPVKTGTDMGGHHDAASYKNTTKDLIGKVGNTPAQSTQEPKPAVKPQLSQAAGVNTKSVIK